ncbi:MAG: tetratricopeptide repeat-containing protein [Pseudomonadales bacterium]|nr:tetratricopeptide repeat-containing protein [Pseudomonadales bacterium]
MGVYRIISVLVLGLCFAGPSFSDDKADPFDLSSISKKAEELGVPTTSEVEEMEKRATELFNSKDCDAAIPALDEYAKKSNWLANLVAAGLRPYYNASYDDRKDFPYRKVSPLTKYEDMANEFKQKRNIAMVMLGECYAAIGDDKKAISYLRRALDLISLDNEEWWERARLGLYKIIKVG